MTEYQIWALIVSGFVAIGTCSAVMIALWLEVKRNKINLIVHSMYGFGFGSVPDIEGGYFTVEITNIDTRPITITMAGFEFKCTPCLDQHPN